MFYHEPGKRRAEAQAVLPHPPSLPGPLCMSDPTPFSRERCLDCGGEVNRNHLNRSTYCADCHRTIYDMGVAGSNSSGPCPSGLASTGPGPFSPSPMKINIADSHGGFTIQCVETKEELPETGDAVGQLMMVGDRPHVWDGEEWHNLGDMARELQILRGTDRNRRAEAIAATRRRREERGE